MTFRRVFLLFVVYLAIDFADPLTVSPITWQVEDGEEEAVETTQTPLKKRERVRRVAPREDREELRERARAVLATPRSAHVRTPRNTWPLPRGRHDLPSSPGPTSSEDH